MGALFFTAEEQRNDDADEVLERRERIMNIQRRVERRQGRRHETQNDDLVEMKKCLRRHADAQAEVIAKRMAHRQTYILADEGACARLCLPNRRQASLPTCRTWMNSCSNATRRPRFATSLSTIPSSWPRLPSAYRRSAFRACSTCIRASCSTLASRRAPWLNRRTRRHMRASPLSPPRAGPRSR